MTDTSVETSAIDHIIASEKYRFETFSSLLNFPPLTRHQLALAGFIHRAERCLCSQCGVTIDLKSLNDSRTYESNYFRKLHREKVSHLGKRCPFLLCESGTNIDDLHPSISSSNREKPLWEDAEEPEYSDFSKRVETFHSWPHLNKVENSFVTPLIMANHGFYFSGPDDGVTCFYCGNILTGWLEAINDGNENIVRLEHARFFPCRFINYIAGGKFVANAGYFHVVSDKERRTRNPMTSKPVISSTKPQSIDECLSTFENWPSNASIKAETLAKNGFYYLGEELRVRCFMCDIQVDNWEHGMTAFGTHKTRSFYCDIVQAMLSLKTDDFQCANEKWRLQTLAGLSFETNCDENLALELAACGFYRFKNTNFIQCAYCGVKIQPKSDSSIMSQHRALAKQSKKSSPIDCLIVRAQCPSNIVIPDRKSFPEYQEFKSVFDRIKSFHPYKSQHKVPDQFIRERADAGFFFETTKRMRCFQCGNSLPIKDKKLYEKYPTYNIEKLHAHFYPTCEWVKEILGSKYVSQVLYDRSKLNENDYQSLFNSQASSTSSRTLHSFPSVSTASIQSEPTPFFELNISDYSAESDYEGYETIATPLRSHYMDKSPSLPSLPLTPASPTAGAQESSPIATAQSCTDTINAAINDQMKSPTLAKQTNPFKISPPGSKTSSMEICIADTSPTDPSAHFANESNRLESFRKHNYQNFAGLKIEEVAYAGFYLNAEGTVVKCPWCIVALTQEQFERILRHRPIIPDSILNDEPWTAMRVHRHEIGQYINREHAWCPWVRREYDGLNPNIMMETSRMRYPEYPSYSTIEKRIQTFASDWDYPAGSLLSNMFMSNAGFINLGKGKVCCFYCGNRMCDFEPRDCPFEEHATFHPLCDYLIEKRGISYVERILKESTRTSQARQRYDFLGPHKIKVIIFDRSGPSAKKNSRTPVKRLTSRSSAITERSSSNSMSSSLDITEDSCQICYSNVAIYEYNPCHHSPMCGECFAKLTPQQHEQCFLCYRPATIHPRTLT